MSICNIKDHKFIEIKKISLAVPGSPSYRIAKEGSVVVCAICGEVREVWEDGTVIVKPIKLPEKNYEENSTASPAQN